MVHATGGGEHRKAALTRALPVVLTSLALVAAASFAGEKRAMESIETYKGQAITVTTVRAPDGGWTASARVTLPGNKTVTVEPEVEEGRAGKSFRSEEDAKGAALRAAAAAIDRSRVSIGKP